MKNSVAIFLIGFLLCCQRQDLPEVPVSIKLNNAALDQKNKRGEDKRASSDAAIQSRKRHNAKPDRFTATQPKATVAVPLNGNKDFKHLKSKADTIYKYFQSKQVAVKFHPLVNGIKVIELFDAQGHLTYRFEEVHKSYSVMVSLTYHKNGAVKKAVVSTNPGASLYHYKSTISFDNSNVPQWKIAEKIPSGIDELAEKFYWNKVKNTWVKQVASQECAPVPVD